MIQNRLIANPDQTIASFEVEKLRSENNSLKKDLAKFVEGSSKLNLLLQNSRLPFSKEGIGYKEDENRNSYDIPVNICRRCGKGNHIEAACKETLVEGLKFCNICDSKKHTSETCSYRSLCCGITSIVPWRRPRWAKSQSTRGAWAVTLLSRKSYALTNSYSFWPSGKCSIQHTVSQNKIFGP